MPELTIVATPSSVILTIPFALEATTQELKLALKALIDGEVGRMVCGGRVLKDELTLLEQGVKEKSKIYVTIAGVNGRVKRSNAQTSSLLSQSKPKEDPLMGPLLKFLANNPELYQQMLLSNPQLQSLLESNPELRHALTDPSTLKSILSAASNPAAYNEMLRGHDRALSNLENIPEGFSHLKRVYKSMQEPMYEALTPQYRAEANAENEVRKELTKDPVPNPWAPQKRKLPTSVADLAEAATTRMTGEFAGQLETLHGLGFVDDEGENMPALRATGGRISAAIDWIMSRRHQ